MPSSVGSARNKTSAAPNPRNRPQIVTMIISASYRSDIPAFYGAWFLKRLESGFCRVVNPYGAQVHEIALTPEAVAGFVFWTRNPGPFRAAFREVARRGFPFVVQITATGYPRALESSVLAPEPEGVYRVDLRAQVKNRFQRLLDIRDAGIALRVITVRPGYRMYTLPGFEMYEMGIRGQ